MSKILIIVRHAKSSWADPSLDDFDRPLNERGRKNAPEMARRLKKTGFRPELFITSPAKRALATARYFARALEYDKDRIIRIPELYHATADQILTRIKDIPEEVGCAILFGHNPGLTELVNFISRIEVDNIPTCGMVILEIDNWQNFGRRNATVRLFDYPKSKN